MSKEAEWETNRLREIRDIFAACALMGMLSKGRRDVEGDYLNDEEQAALAYDYADAMIAERAKRNEAVSQS